MVKVQNLGTRNRAFTLTVVSARQIVRHLLPSPSVRQLLSSFLADFCFEIVVDDGGELATVTGIVETLANYTVLVNVRLLSSLHHSYFFSFLLS